MFRWLGSPETRKLILRAPIQFEGHCDKQGSLAVDLTEAFASPNLPPSVHTTTSGQRCDVARKAQAALRLGGL